MFDGTFRLLKMEAKFLWALVTLTFTIGTAVVRAVTWLVRKMLRREAPAQASAAPAEPVIPTPLRSATPAAAPSPAPAASAPVTVNVTINNGGASVAPSPPAAAATPAPAPSQPSTGTAPSLAAQARRPAALVLGNPDHGIYLTTGSSFMVPHPYAAGLLEQLDYMLYQGAHRKGRPWNVPPALDTSGRSQLATPLANLVMPDDGVDEVRRHVLPHDPEGVWIARSGRPFERQRPHKLREEVVRRRTPAPAPPPVLAGVWPDGIDICPVRALPAADGAIWVARTARDFERQVSSN